MRISTRILRGMAPRIRWLPHAAGSLVLFLGLAESKAQPPRATETGAAQGTVERMTTAPRGEIDGALLDDGTWLHWPPHLQDRFADVVRAGDRVRATGRIETGPAGDTHFEIETVTNVRTKASADNPDYAFGPSQPPAFRGRGRPGPPPLAFGPPDPHGREWRGPPPPRTQDRRMFPADRGTIAAVEVRGTVQRMTTAPRGEIDGAILDDGTWLHWPPHMQDRFTSVVKEGDRVRATGQMESGPAGDTHFEISRVTNMRTNTASENPDRVFSPPPPRDAGRDAGPGTFEDREQRLRDLENQIRRLQRELDRLRGE